MASIKSNIFYNSALVMANYIFPLLVFPYISRVLGVTNIGICNFVDSIINYYCLFAMLGMNSLAIREIAINKDNKDNLSKVFSSLFVLNIIISSIVILGLIISIFCVPRFYEYRYLMFIGVSKLIFQILLVEWLYTGIENFRYITLRSIFIRSIYVILVFILIRDTKDYPIYYLLLTLTTVFNAMFNIAYSKKFVNFSLKGISIKKYIKPLFSLGAYGLLTSFYTTFNVLFLGLVSDATEVGYYTTSTKLHAMILAFFTAITGVLMPRMASLISTNNKETVDRLLNKTYHILFLIAFPIIVFCEVFASDFILMFAGAGYEKVVFCFRIVAPLILVVGYEQILVFQILMPAKKDNMVLTNAFCAALIGIVGNIIFVPSLASLGSSIVWVISELCILFMAQYFSKRALGFSFPLYDLFIYIGKAFPIALFVTFLAYWRPLGIYTQFLGFFSIVIYYLILEFFLLKNEILTSLLTLIKK